MPCLASTFITQEESQSQSQIPTSSHVCITYFLSEEMRFLSAVDDDDDKHDDGDSSGYSQ